MYEWREALRRAVAGLNALSPARTSFQRTCDPAPMIMTSVALMSAAAG